MIYADNTFFFLMMDNGQQTQTTPTTPPKTQQHNKIPKAPKRPKRKQKNQNTSVALNNILLSFEKATPINYNRNNLFTP